MAKFALFSALVLAGLAAAQANLFEYVRETVGKGGEEAVLSQREHSSACPSSARWTPDLNVCPSAHAFCMPLAPPFPLEHVGLCHSTDLMQHSWGTRYRSVSGGISLPVPPLPLATQKFHERDRCGKQQRRCGGCSAEGCALRGCALRGCLWQVASAMPRS